MSADNKVLKYKIMHATGLAKEYGLEVKTQGTRFDNDAPAEYVTQVVMEHSLDLAAADGWSLQHVLGMPFDPLLYLTRVETGA